MVQLGMSWNVHMISLVMQCVCGATRDVMECLYDITSDVLCNIYRISLMMWCVCSATRDITTVMYRRYH